MPDVYSYDKLPDTLKAQIIQIWKDIHENDIPDNKD